MPAALLLLGVPSTATSGDTTVLVRGGKMATRMYNGKMVLTGLKGEVAGGQVHMSGRVAVQSERANSAALKFTDIPVAKAADMIGQPGVAAWLGDAMISGYAKGQWQGQGLKEISRSADGALVVETGPGVITETAALDRLEKITGISELKQLSYSGMRLQVHAADGKIVIDSITVHGPDFNLKAAGTYQANADDLELRIDASVAPELAAKSSYMKLSNVMGFLRGEEKPESDEFVEIPRLLVSGELKKPDVKIDKSKQVAAPAQPKETQTANASPDSVLKRASNFILSHAD